VVASVRDNKMSKDINIRALKQILKESELGLDDWDCRCSGCSCGWSPDPRFYERIKVIVELLLQNES